MFEFSQTEAASQHCHLRVLRNIKSFFLTLLLAFKEVSVRSLADCVDNRTETSMVTHGKEYSLCKDSLEEISKQRDG